jgi:hypothetical protein
MKKRRSNPVPPEIDALAGLPKDQIDTEDITEVGAGTMLNEGCFITRLSSRLRCVWMLIWWIGLRVIISRMRVIRLVLTGICGSMFHSIGLEAFWREDGIYEEV